MNGDNSDASFSDERAMSSANGRTWKRWAFRSAIAIVVAGIVGATWLVYVGIATSLRAENALHATRLTTQVIEDHVRQHNGQWPRSWTELERSSRRSRAMFKWPNDRTEIQRYVWVDFDANSNDLARQSADGFDAIKSIGPHYPWEDYPELSSLLETLRSTRASQEKHRD
jgi:hypothetical protein